MAIRSGSRTAASQRIAAKQKGLSVPSPEGKIAPQKRTAVEKITSAYLAPEERRRLIAEAAYLIAEKRGFAPGNELDDWLQAEAEVDARLMRAAMQ